MVKTSNGHGLIFLVMVSLILFIGSISYVFATEKPKQPQISNYNIIKSSTTINAEANANSKAFSYAKGGNSTSNSSAAGGNAVVSGVQGGSATSSSGGNSLTVNNPQQWPSSFVSGFSASSPAGCRTGLGVQGGYGGIVLPIDDEDCELVIAAQMELQRGNIWSYCRLMEKTEAYEIARITFNDCRANHEPTSQYRPNLSFPTPASDKLKEIYPGIGQ